VTLRTTQWSPDTCNCVIQYSWEDSLPPDQRTHTLATVVSRCSAHAGFSGQAHFDQVTTENTRKNRVHGAILANIPALTQTITNPDGTTSVSLKNGVTLNWSFDTNRHLMVTLSGATAAQKAQLQTLADSAFGAGAVTIQ
jgi:hypothetical protein